MMHYDPSKDRSEEFGWKKVCDEHVPTEEEQRLWGNIMIGCVLFTILMLFFL
jgi:hypothetical protein